MSFHGNFRKPKTTKKTTKMKKFLPWTPSVSVATSVTRLNLYGGLWPSSFDLLLLLFIIHLFVVSFVDVLLLLGFIFFEVIV
jgi:hypothetical protein